MSTLALTITLDPQTHMVCFRCDGIAVSVAQMMIDEVARQLDIARKQAAQLELVAKMQEQERIAALVSGRNGRG